MGTASAAPAWQVALIMLTGTVVGIVVLAGLYWAQAVCVPVALAMYLSFLLAPLVTALQRRGIGRTPSVLLVVLAVMLVLGGVVWVIGVQARNLADEVPKYAESIQAKLASLRQAVDQVGIKRLEKLLGQSAREPRPASGADRLSSDDTAGDAAKEPIAVVVRSEGLDWLKALPGVLGRMAEAIGGMVLVLVLLVFMLLNRQDLRNRLIRLAGDGRITATTRALDDAAQRIRQYLRMQLMVNAAFGLTLAIALRAVGVHYAFLLGFLGFLLRYLPYVGPWIAAAPPLLLSLAMSGGWMQPLVVLGLFVTIELVTSSVVEPRLYGHSIGVSEVALLVAAAFWSFLWGPVGLVLSSPLTVCMVALGKYIPHLRFLDVLLGDEPALDADVAFYQRLLARDQDEAEDLVLTRIKTSSLEEVYDELLIAALTHVIRDRERDDLGDADEQFVLQATEEILEDLGERHDDARADKGDAAAGPPAGAKIPILACPARHRADGFALTMLQQLLDPAKWQITVTAVGRLTSEVVSQVAEQQSKLVCIAALPPGGLAHTRYLCKRLRARFPTIKIIVGRWGLKGDLVTNRQQLEEAGADAVATTLLETRSQLASLMPVLAQEPTRVETPAKQPDQSRPMSDDDRKRDAPLGDLSGHFHRQSITTPSVGPQ